MERKRKCSMVNGAGASLIQGMGWTPPHTARGLMQVAPPFLRATAAVIILACAGCICQPGGRIVINVGWRSAQCGSATNVLNETEGGGAPQVTVPVSAIP